MLELTGCVSVAGGLGWDLPVAALSISSLHTGRCGDQGHTSQCQGEPRPPHPAPNRYTDTLTSTILTILVPGLCHPSELPCEAVTVRLVSSLQVPGASCMLPPPPGQR